MSSLGRSFLSHDRPVTQTPIGGLPMTHTFTPQCRRPRTRAALPLALLAGLGHRSARGQCQDRHPAPLLTRDEQHFRRRSRAPGAPEHTVGSRRYVRQHRDRLRRQPRAARRHAQRLGPPALHDHEHQQHGSDGACSGQIAIGGSMLLANHERFTLSASPPRPESTEVPESTGTRAGCSPRPASATTIRVSY